MATRHPFPAFVRKNLNYLRSHHTLPYDSCMNLTADPWIPVVTVDGHRELGLREVFASADRIAGVCSGDSVIDAALMRLLMAIDAAATAAGSPTAEWVGDHRERFELFDERRPFWQNPNMSQLWEVKGAAIAASTLVRPNSSPQSMVHSMESAMGEAFGTALTPAQAARCLVMRQQFSTGGIQPGIPKAAYGSTSAKAAIANIAPFVWVQAPTLHDALTANRIHEVRGTFHFSWPDEASPFQEAAADGVIDMLTWPARAMLLHRNPDGMVDTYLCTDGLRCTTKLTAEHLPYTTFEQAKRDSPWTVRGISYQRPGWRQLLDAYAAGSPGVIEEAALRRAVPPDSCLRIIGLSSFQARVDGHVDDTIPIPTIARSDAAALSAAVVDAFKTAGSAVGSAAATLGFGKEWSDRRRPTATTGIADCARPIVCAALVGDIAVADAVTQIAAIGQRAAQSVVADLTPTYPAAAGKLAARSHKGTP